MSNLSDLFLNIYETHGQYAVIDYIRNRQSVGDLQDITWAICPTCDYESPILEGVCCVCSTVVTPQEVKGKCLECNGNPVLLDELMDTPECGCDTWVCIECGQDVEVTL